MKHILFVLVAIFCIETSNSQSVQWVLNPYTTQSLYENDLTRLATDGAGNVYDLVNRACGSFSCPAFTLFSSSPNGQNYGSSPFFFQVSPTTSYNSPQGIDIVVDSSGNKYISGHHGGDSILIGNTWIKSPNFIFKSGTSSWVKPGTGIFAADNHGNCYLTNGIFTEKYDSIGNVLWNNPTVGGPGISVDNSGNCFITNGSGTTKLNSQGIVSWSNNIGGSENYMDISGNIYVVNGNQITKRDNFNNPLWVKSFPGEKKRINRNGIIYTADGLTLTKYNSNGTFNWSYCAVTDSGSIEDIAFDYSGNVFTTGKFYGNSFYSNTPPYFNAASITFCPFVLGAVAPNSYIAKIAPSLNTAPRLVMIDNQQMSGPIQNCTVFQLEYATCCDSFGAGNAFIVQIASDTSFSNSTIVGTLSSTSSGTIPVTIPLNSIDSGYIRVISTIPQVASNYKFIKIDKSPEIQIYVQGSTAFCQGKGPVQLSANSDYTYNNQWQKNNIDIPGATFVDYFANTAGNYRFVRTTSTGCSKYSDTVSVVTFSNPSASIASNGPTHFCTGGSSLLTANSGNNLSYQWKKNGSLIAGANLINYSSTKTGTYKVLVTNANGCTKLSNGISVTGPPTASILAGGPLTFCVGDSVVLIANSGTGYSYQWKKNGSFINGAISINYPAKTGGNYKAIITDTFGCSVTSNTKTVTVNCREELDYSLHPDAIIYPNPSSEEFTINIKGSEGKSVLIRVIDMVGKEWLRNEKIQSEGQDFSFGSILIPGNYIVEIIIGNRTMHKKVVKL